MVNKVVCKCRQNEIIKEFYLHPFIHTQLTQYSVKPVQNRLYYPKLDGSLLNSIIIWMQNGITKKIRVGVTMLT